MQIVNIITNEMVQVRWLKQWIGHCLNAQIVNGRKDKMVEVVLMRQK